MTEYATDPDAIHEFLTARERCTNWVTIHGHGLSFVSPSSPPSVLSDEDALGYGPSESDASSSHSLPPRMLLRYDDGRPDIPISHAHDHLPPHPRTPPSSSHRSRSRSGGLAPPSAADNNIQHLPPLRTHTLSYASGARYAPSPHHLATPPRSPENIRILQPRQPEDAHRMPGASTSSHHSRVPSAQAIFPPHQPSIRDRVPPADPLHTSTRSVLAPTPRHAPSPSRPIPVIASPPHLAQAHSPPASGSQNSGSRFYEQPGMAASALHPGLPYHYSPPAIVYAPSSKHGRSNYHPPQIVYSPSSHAHRRPAQPPAPGIAYSRSDPLPHPTHYSSSPQANAGSTPFHSVQGSVSHSHRSRQRSHSTNDRDAAMSRGRSRASSSARDRARTRPPTPPLSESDTSSDSSGSTYYVLPSPGQKVQIVVPNSASVYTTTPKTPRSPSSPSSAGSLKKPFFQRLFSRGSGSVDSRGSSGQARAERGRIPVPWR